MVDIKDLKKINFMKDLSDEVLEKVATVAQLENFDEETILIRQDQNQHLVYMLVSGTIYLNCRASRGQSLTLDELRAGQTFGLSSLLDNSPATYTAICAEDSPRDHHFVGPDAQPVFFGLCGRISGDAAGGQPVQESDEPPHSAFSSGPVHPPGYRWPAGRGDPHIRYPR